MGTGIDRAALILVAVVASAGCDTREDEGEAPPTFRDVQQLVFTPKCSQASCHSVQFHAGDLILEEGMAYEQLLGAVSNQAAADEGLVQIAVGEPEDSFLWIKLDRELEARHGAVMPLGSNDGLPDADLDLIRRWIAAGAIND
ncbi:MAG: hypothetical protein K0V04_24670 [Deltaproteobacteria bacterium]|nr:hypothetical protein [Deltaproteobacteria bacterium]